MHFQYISTNDSTECGCIRQCNLWSVPFICVYPITGATQWFNSFGSHKCLNLLSARPLFTMAAGAGKEAGSMEAGTDDSRKVLPSLQDGEWATDMCDCCAEPGDLAGCGYGAAIPMCMYAENLKHQPTHSMCAASNECGSCVSFAATAFGGARRCCCWVSFRPRRPTTAPRMAIALVCSQQAAQTLRYQRKLLRRLLKHQCSKERNERRNMGLIPVLHFMLKNSGAKRTRDARLILELSSQRHGPMSSRVAGE